MPAYTNKIDVITKITELLGEGQVAEAMRLQKVFIESIRCDKSNGKFNVNIKLDRASKKAIKSADIPSLTMPSTRIR